MTHSLTNHLDREFGHPDANDIDGVRECQVVEFGELLERVRYNALRFISDVPRPPQVLRIRAGEVSVEVEWAEERVAVITASTPATASAPSAELPGPVEGTSTEAPECYLTAPTVGVFHQAPKPGAPPFVREGDTVVVGQQVGIVEVMKLMIPVEAEAAGRVVKVIKGNGEPVEYGEPLFALAPVDPS